MIIWKDIENYEELYEVSNTGLVRSKYRNILQKHGFYVSYPSKILKADKSGVRTIDGKMYQRVTLSKEHKTKRYFVHRLVAQTFISNPNNKPHVNHIDNDPENNAISNLEWVTHSENMTHAQRQGRLYNAQSSGGKTGGIVSINLENKIDSLLGTTVGIYTLNSVHHRTPGKTYFNVICSLCGTSHKREMSYILNGNATRCNSCKKVKI